MIVTARVSSDTMYGVFTYEGVARVADYDGQYFFYFPDEPDYPSASFAFMASECHILEVRDD